MTFSASEGAVMAPPDVLHWLKALGFTYTRQAEALGISQPMVSKWLKEERPVPAHHYRDLVRLYLRATELVRAGKDPREALTTWSPLTLVTENAEGEVMGVSHTGSIAMPPEFTQLLWMLTTQQQRGEISTETRIMLQNQLTLVAGLRTLQKITPTDPWQLSLDADTIDTLLRTLAALTLTVEQLADDLARERAQTTPHEDAPHAP
jgi:hypothetical protein